MNLTKTRELLEAASMARAWYEGNPEGALEEIETRAEEALEELKIAIVGVGLDYMGTKVISEFPTSHVTVRYIPLQGFEATIDLGAGPESVFLRNGATASTALMLAYYAAKEWVPIP